MAPRDPKDGVRLGDAPALRHLVAVLPDGGRWTAGDLVSKAPDPVRAPDPSDRLRALRAENPGPDGECIEIRTWNLALLDATVFGLIPWRRSPRLTERRALLPGLVAAADAEIVLLQEVWGEADRTAIEAAARTAGFLTFHGPRRRYDDGLVTLIRAALVRGGPSCVAAPYDDHDPREFFPGPRVRRGWLEAAFEHPRLGWIRVLNTHLMAWPKNAGLRLRQARQLGLRAGSGPGLVFVGGDLNAAPYYPRDVWVHPSGRREAGWWKNSLSWAVLQHYGGLSDLGVRGAEDPTRDVALLDALVPDADGRVDVRRFAAQTRHPSHFTATDENSLYAAQYLGTEYPARIDQLFARDPGGRVHVAEITPKEAAPISALGCAPSDHHAVQLRLRVRPA